MNGLNPSMGAREWALLLLLSVLWGGSFFFIGIAVKSVPPLTLVLIRVALAAAVLVAVLIVTGRRLPLLRGAIGAFFLLALLNNVIPFALFAWGQKQIASGLASILNATTPLWGVIVAHIFTDDERMTPLKVGGVTLGFVGVAIMIGGDFLLDLGASHPLAQLACLAATLCYGLAGVYSRRFKRMGIDPVATSTGQLIASSVMMLPLVLLFEPPWRGSPPGPDAWMALGALAVFSTALAYIIYFQLIARAGATNAILVTFLIPVTAILLGSLFLGETLALRHFAGMALIGSGLAAIDGRLPRAIFQRVSPAPLP